MSMGRSFGPMLVRWRAWELPPCDGSLHRFRRPPLPEPAGRRPSGLRPVLSCDSHKLVPTPDSFLSSFLIRWPAGAVEWWKFDPVILLLKVEVGFLWSKAEPCGLGAGLRVLVIMQWNSSFAFNSNQQGNPSTWIFLCWVFGMEVFWKVVDNSGSWLRRRVTCRQEAGRVHYWLMRQLCGRHKHSQTPLINFFSTLLFHWKYVFIHSW